MRDYVNVYISDLKEIDSANDMVLYCGYSYLMENDEVSEPLNIIKGKDGKPDFDKNLHFNISHSGKYWVCAISRQPVGVDLQLNKNMDYAPVARKMFVNEEMPKDLSDFYRLWTAKEAYVKYTGKGLKDYKNFTIDGHNIKVDKETKANLSYLKFTKEYTLCVCTKERVDLRLIEL